MNDKITILYVEGVEGNSLYIGDYRVCGPKPWGGGKVLKKWNANRQDIEKALEGGRDAEIFD